MKYLSNSLPNSKTISLSSLFTINGMASKSCTYLQTRRDVLTEFKGLIASIKYLYSN